MKKILKYLKQNIIGFFVGLLVMGTGVYAATVISAVNVGYIDNSSLGADNVQDAIDKLNIKADNQYFDLETAKANKTGTIFASKKGICISRNKTVYCFKVNSWTLEKDYLQQVFSDVSCSTGSTDITCSASDFSCGIYSGGGVCCNDQSASSNCCITASGLVVCG